MEIPKVSVIVPIYKVEKYIARCAESLFDQTLDGLEIIFINDCSPDNSMKVLEETIENSKLKLEKSETHIRIVNMPTNSGQTAVRRRGVQLCTGEFVIHCDSDDWIEPQMYEAMYDLAKRKGVDITICDYYISTDESDKRVAQDIPSSKDDLLGSIIDGRVHSSCCNKLVKRSLYDNVEMWPKADMREDLALMTQLIYYSTSFAYLPHSFYHYYVNQTSISQNNEVEHLISRYKQSVQNYESIMSFLRKRKCLDRYNNEIQYLQFHIKIELAPLTFRKEQYHYWCDAFPELKVKDVLLLKIPLKRKMKYLLFSIVELLKRL